MLERIACPADLRALDQAELTALAQEIREFIVSAVTVTGGHLGSNLGAVELTLAVHRVFDSPRDIILWDTGHQAYVHKIVTGRQAGFAHLRQAGGLSGYPSRAESEHDWVENSHASTILSYAHGVATAVEHLGLDRRVVAIIGDGSMTGGMAFEGLNNLGHSHRRVVIVLNDNGRSYAPTVSLLSESLTRLRLNPSWVAARTRVGEVIRDLPGVGNLASASLQGLRSAIREVLEPPVFFEALGVRYTGPIDGHDIAGMEHALHNAAEYDGPIVVHVLTEKGKGYPPAEDDEIQNLHDLKVSVPSVTPTVSYTESFTDALIAEADSDERIVAITAAMPGPTGLLPVQAKFPERCFDVGIAEQHAVTTAAGMAMVGLRPVVAVYSTFFTRAFDQANLDVGLHGLPVVFALDRAGITGDDGASHHGVLDLSLCLTIPGMTVFAPSTPAEIPGMLHEAIRLDGPSAIRWPKTPSPVDDHRHIGHGLKARRVRQGDGHVCILAVGKLLHAAEEAAELLDAEGIDATVWDVRVVKPLDPAMISDAAHHGLVVTAEDGIRFGGAGSFIADAIRDDETRQSPPVLILGTPIEFMAQGKPADILARLGLDGPGLAQAILRAHHARLAI